MAQKRSKPFFLTPTSDPVVAAEGHEPSPSIDAGVREELESLLIEEPVESPLERAPSAAKAPRPPKTADELVDDHKKDLELSRLRKENKTLLKKLLMVEKRLEVVEAFRADGVVERLAPITRRLKGPKTKREGIAIVLASDWHVEEEVKLEKTNGLNEYTLSIAWERIRRFTENVIGLLEKEGHTYFLPELILWLGGDFFTGYIHEENVENAQLSPVESVVWLNEKLIWVIDTLLAETKLERITVPCNHGNHGRTTPKIRVSTGAENSYEWLLYSFLETHYRDNERVRVYAPKTHLLYLDVYESRIRAIHGMDFRYSGGGGGIIPSMNRVIANFDASIPANLTVFGHWHNYMPLRHALGNGSLIGHSAYSDWVHAPYAPPRQAFCIWDAERGEKTADHPIWVDVKKP